jgi:hypothetical protein
MALSDGSGRRIVDDRRAPRGTLCRVSELQLLLWLTAVHFVGFICIGLLMIPVLRHDDDTGADQDSGGADDGWGNLPAKRPDSGNRPGGGLPLPDAEPSRIRLRQPGRISEQLPGFERRPVREPERRPAREPERRPARESARARESAGARGGVRQVRVTRRVHAGRLSGR